MRLIKPKVQELIGFRISVIVPACTGKWKHLFIFAFRHMTHYVTLWLSVNKNGEIIKSERVSTGV